MAAIYFPTMAISRARMYLRRWCRAVSDASCPRLMKTDGYLQPPGSSRASRAAVIIPDYVRRAPGLYGIVWQQCGRRE